MKWHEKKEGERRGSRMVRRRKGKIKMEERWIHREKERKGKFGWGGEGKEKGRDRTEKDRQRGKKRKESEGGWKDSAQDEFDKENRQFLIMFTFSCQVEGYDQLCFPLVSDVITLAIKNWPLVQAIKGF